MGSKAASHRFFPVWRQEAALCPRGWCGPRGLAVVSGSWWWGERHWGVRRANLQELDGEDFVSEGVFWGSKQFIEITYFYL